MYDDSLEISSEEEPVEEVPVEEVKEKASTTSVKVIKENDEAALVEYLEKGVLQRAYIPIKHLIDGNKVKDAQLKKGIPFGIDWSEIELPTITPKMLTQALRLRGIWTAVDVRANPQAVRNAINQVQGDLFKQVVNYISGK